MNKLFVEDFVKLLRENPDVEVKCEVDSDIVADDGYAWWLGNLKTDNPPRIEEYSTDINESITYKGEIISRDVIVLGGKVISYK